MLIYARNQTFCSNCCRKHNYVHLFLCTPLLYAPWTSSLDGHVRNINVAIIIIINSVNKAPKMLIFGLNTLCGILSNYTWKNAGIKINFLCFYCFMNFLCISLFFRPFFVVVFFSEICGRHFLKHNNAKTN